MKLLRKDTPMKKTISLVIVLMMLLTLFSGCGKDQESTVSKEEASDETDNWCES